MKRNDKAHKSLALAVMLYLLGGGGVALAADNTETLDAMPTGTPTQIPTDTRMSAATP